jgi:hypothetical protein
LKIRETIGCGDQLLAEGIEIFQSLVETQIFEPIDADLHPHAGRKLFSYRRAARFLQ